MLELEGTPQDIVDFRRKFVPALIFHACPMCGDEMDLRQARDMDKPDEWSFICWECEENFSQRLPTMSSNASSMVIGQIDEDKRPQCSSTKTCCHGLLFCQ